MESRVGAVSGALIVLLFYIIQVYGLLHFITFVVRFVHLIHAPGPRGRVVPRERHAKNRITSLCACRILIILSRSSAPENKLFRVPLWGTSAGLGGWFTRTRLMPYIRQTNAAAGRTNRALPRTAPRTTLT